MSEAVQQKEFLEHLQELRFRLLISFMAFLCASIVGYLLRNWLQHVILLPLKQTVYYTSPAGGLSFIIEISLLFGGVVSLPILLFQIFRFIEPALSTRLRGSVVWIFLGSLFLTSIGASFAYFVILPATLNFLSNFNSTPVQSLITVDEYLSFVTRFIVGFSLLYHLPLALTITNGITRLTVKQLMGFQRWVILVAVLLGAVITPTFDIFNQALIAIPIIFLYQISVGIVLITNLLNKKGGGSK